MSSQVFFTTFRSKHNLNLYKKLNKLINKLSLDKVLEKGDITAVKLHFGEKGNMAYVSPQFVRVIVDKLKGYEVKPFLTDTNTLYVGSRGEAVSHIQTAISNGFAYSVVDAPLIIADGLRGRSYNMVDIGKKWYKQVDIASEIFNADSLIAVTHFKCHELTGIGGVIKNIGMGCSGVQGKLNQHSGINPFVADGCTGCKRCTTWCNHGAIIFNEKGKASITKKCVGCGECILPCPAGVINVKWNAKSSSISEKIVEHVYGAIKNKNGKCAYITFVNNISPACDCYGMNDVPIVNDIGILASLDPVAIDQAAADLINNADGNKGSKLASSFLPGEDKFRSLYPDIDWTIQLSYGEEIGLGKRDYELVSVG